MSAIRLACFWPGLAAAWYRGAAVGLFVSVMFSWFVCLLLLATFVWPNWFSRWLVVPLWLAVAVYWLVESVRSQVSLRAMLQPTSEDTTEAFALAQKEYLRGNWFEAEAILLKIVQQHPRDASAGLLLVGVLRHTQRWRPALRRLEQLCLLESAAAWGFEIAQERRLIERAIEEDQELPEQSA